jgi:hypothetical protein
LLPFETKEKIRSCRYGYAPIRRVTIKTALERNPANHRVTIEIAPAHNIFYRILLALSQQIGDGVLCHNYYSSMETGIQGLRIVAVLERQTSLLKKDPSV